MCIRDRPYARRGETAPSAVAGPTEQGFQQRHDFFLRAHDDDLVFARNVGAETDRIANARVIAVIVEARISLDLADVGDAIGIQIATIRNLQPALHRSVLSVATACRLVGLGSGCKIRAEAVSYT